LRGYALDCTCCCGHSRSLWAVLGIHRASWKGDKDSDGERSRCQLHDIDKLRHVTCVCQLSVSRFSACESRRIDLLRLQDTVTHLKLEYIPLAAVSLTTPISYRRKSSIGQDLRSLASMRRRSNRLTKALHRPNKAVRFLTASHHYRMSEMCESYLRSLVQMCLVHCRLSAHVSLYGFSAEIHSPNQSDTAFISHTCENV